MKTHEGVLRTYNPLKAFGFIHHKNDDESVEAYFMHVTDIVQGSPVIGQRARFNVDYRVPTGQHPHAIHVEIDYRENIEAAKEALSKPLPNVTAVTCE
jgi:cold shock CspA family protein